MQGNQNEIEQKALKVKQDREEHLKRLEEEKNKEEYDELRKKKENEEKSKQFTYKVKSIIAVILFAVIVGLHLTLSLLERDYTGVEISFRKYADRIMSQYEDEALDVLPLVNHCRIARLMA
jgi:uncharacterized ion transporter superfamily protein YfcC